MRISEFHSDNQKLSSTIIFVMVLLLAFWFYSKLESVGHSVLELEITENKEIILDGNRTSLQDFPFLISSSITQLETNGINRDDIVIAIQADKSLSMGLITDVQQEIRNCNLNKIVYER